MGLEETTTETVTTILPKIIKNMSQASFSWYDYVLFSGMLGLSALIGIYFGCFGTKQSSVDEYLMGNKKMKVLPVSISLVASHVSGVTLLAIPADVYRYGAAFWLFVPAIFFVTLSTIFIYLPVFYKLQITSTYEYLERRFDKSTRMFASFLFALGLFLYLPIVIYTPALAFSVATGISIHYITPVVCGICIFYTTLGGLKAVVWTDTLQFTVTTGAVIAVVIIGIKSAGGFAAIWYKAVEGHRLDIFDFDPDPTKRDSFWIVVIGIGIGWLSMVGIHQSCVQKFLSVPTLRDAKISAMYFTIGISLVCSFSIFTGLIMYAKYADCDPFTSGTVQKNDQLLPYYVIDVASQIPGLPGLFIAGIFCAALSTLSASLNCLAGTIFEDFVLKITGPFENEKTAAFILKLLVVITGILCTALVFIVEHLGGLLPLCISLGGVTSGPLLGMFTLGVLFPKCSSKGAFYGSLIGLVFSGWIVTMAQYYKANGIMVDVPKTTSVQGCTNFNLTGDFNNSLSSFAYFSAENYTFLNASIENNSSLNEEPTKYQPFFLFRISYYYYTALGTLATMICGLILSYLPGNDDPPVHRDLLSPVIYFLLPEEKAVNEKNNQIDKSIHIVTKLWSYTFRL